MIKLSLRITEQLFNSWSPLVDLLWVLNLFYSEIINLKLGKTNLNLSGVMCVFLVLVTILMIKMMTDV